MNIFISWSGDHSKKIASTLKNWLSDVFQSDQFFMSLHDIDAGARWANKLNSALEDSNFGIVCLTQDNLKAPWLLFEAGALSKAIQGSHVVPYLLDLKTTDIDWPLAQFQGVSSDKEGTLKLVQSINEIRETKLSEEKLQRSFNKWWPDLEAQLNKILSQLRVPPENQNEIPIVRSERAMIEEILELVRPKNKPHSRQNVTIDQGEMYFENQSVHNYSSEDLVKMTTDQILRYIEQVNKRYSITPYIGEETALEGKRKIAEAELAKRKNQ